MIKDITIECCNCSFQNTLSTKIEHQTKIKKYFWCKECNQFQGYLLDIQKKEIKILVQLDEFQLKQPVLINKKTNISLTVKKK